MKPIFHLFFINFFLLIHGLNIDEERGLRGTYTTTSTITQTVTSLVPSSCVQVEATLEPCRNFRYLRFPKLPTITFNDPEAKQEVISNWRTGPASTTPLGWGEYFGLFAPTVTVTATELKVATVEDPAVVVTFAVKGCKPWKLPVDVDRCPPTLYERELPLAEKIATSTVVHSITPTKTLNSMMMSTLGVIRDEGNGLEGSQSVVEEETVQPTNTLAI